MPKNSVTREELITRVLKLKTELYDGSWSAKNRDWHEGGQSSLNRVLDVLEEYRF